MPFGDPDELKQEKALAFRTLTQALADLIGIVEHGGKRVPATVDSDDLRDKPKEREALLAEVTDWFSSPDDVFAQPGMRPPRLQPRGVEVSGPSLP
jgi:hypothetical protein